MNFEFWNAKGIAPTHIPIDDTLSIVYSLQPLFCIFSLLCIYCTVLLCIDCPALVSHY